jgi:branched-chain amino acid aminotransferase
MSDVQFFAVTASGPLSLAVPFEAKTVHELFEELPDGIYTALCTFDHNKFFHLEDHLDRLESSIAMLGLNFELDRLTLRRALHEVCTKYPRANARIRIDVLAEPAGQLAIDSRLLIALAPFEPIPERSYLEGVRVEIARELTRPQPQAKVTEFVMKRRHYLESDPSVHEYLLLDTQGRLLEGTTSNFFAVRDGVLRTAGRDVLEGIARKIVLQIAGDLEIPVYLEPVEEEEVSTLQEAALTSASRGIVPIVEIAGRSVGTGRPGPIVSRILAAYRERLAAEIQPAVIM